MKIPLTWLWGFSRLAVSLGDGARPSFYSPLKMLTRWNGGNAEPDG
jgi:hypothetical protein